MISTFIGVTCPASMPIFAVCLSQECHICPFICAGICFCRGKHGGNCCIKSLQQLDNDIKTILKFQFFIVYSHNYKGNSIHVAGRFALQTKPPEVNQRIALTYDPIPLMGNETVNFRLSRVVGCVGVGVFVRQVLQRHQYRYNPDGDYLNHGCFMLLSNNLLYSHTRKDENGRAVKKFELKENDVIKVKYEAGKVTFVYRFLQQSLAVDVRVDEHLHFGVYLYEVEDEVEIVNTFVNGG